MPTFSKLTIFFFFIFSTSLLLGCADTEKIKPSGFNSDFVFDTNQSFEKYIDYTKENILKKGRLDLDRADADKIVDWNAPFLLNPPKSCAASEKKRGLLLIHGLSDSPFSMKSLGEHFQKKCFTVFGILLTGHGTRPGDLLEVSYKSWRNQVKYAVAKLKEKVDEVYLGGFSTGGVLAFDYANTDQDVAGLILIAPSFKLPFAASFAGAVKYFRPMISWHDNRDVVKYESLALNGVAQLNKLLKVLDTSLSKSDLNTKKVKVFTAISYEDTTIEPIKSIDYLLDHIDLKKSKIVIYHQQDSKLPDRFLSKENIIPIVSTMSTVSTAGDTDTAGEKKILNFSHVSLLHHQTNKWYGIDGEYRNCLHYEKDSENRLSCQNQEDVMRGEVTKKNLSKGVVARITFNPMLEELFSSMDQFFNN